VDPETLDKKNINGGLASSLKNLYEKSSRSKNEYRGFSRI
jgi:hypothetical protein